MLAANVVVGQPNVNLKFDFTDAGWNLGLTRENFSLCNRLSNRRREVPPSQEDWNLVALLRATLTFV